MTTSSKTADGGKEGAIHGAAARRFGELKVFAVCVRDVDTVAYWKTVPEQEIWSAELPRPLLVRGADHLFMASEDSHNFRLAVSFGGGAVCGKAIGCSPAWRRGRPGAATAQLPAGFAEALGSKRDHRACETGDLDEVCDEVAMPGESRQPAGSQKIPDPWSRLEKRQLRLRTSSATAVPVVAVGCDGFPLGASVVIRTDGISGPLPVHVVDQPSRGGLT